MVPELSIMRFETTTSPISAEADDTSETVSEGLFGQSLDVLETSENWCRIRMRRDAYEGFVPLNAIVDSPDESSHWVCARATLIFDKPDIKSRIRQRILFGSEVCVQPDFQSTLFVELKTGGFVWSQHLESMDESLQSTTVSIIEEHFLGAPYLWGGRSPDGCDCSGLVQMVCFARGLALPRDSADQEAFLDQAVSMEQRRRGDLVFWKGHVGILESEGRLLHATAHSLNCCVEPLQSVIDRAGAPTSIKRLRK